MDTRDEGHRRDWQHGAIDQITQAHFVVIVASPVCRAVGDGTYAAADHGGIRSELDTIRNLLQQHPRWQAYLLPVVLPGESIHSLPLFLKPHTADRFLIEELTQSGISGLVRTIRKTPRRTWPLR